MTSSCAGLRPLVVAALFAAGAARTPVHYTIEDGKVQAMESQQPVPALVRAGGPVFELNPPLFGGNVLREQGRGQSEHWVVTFCPSWWEGCQALLEQYQGEAAQWQARLNDDLLSVRTRFGFVDCAGHKTLCNEQVVEEYPTVVHYHRGARVGQWNMNGKSDAGRLTAWLQAELGHVPSAASPEVAELAEAAEGPGWRALAAPGVSRDLLLIAAVLAANCWAFLSSGESPKKEPPAAPAAADESPKEAPRGAARFLPRDWAAARGASLEL